MLETFESVAAGFEAGDDCGEGAEGGGDAGVELDDRAGFDGLEDAAGDFFGIWAEVVVGVGYGEFSGLAVLEDSFGAGGPVESGVEAG
jgi:hypothetical protein